MFGFITLRIFRLRAYSHKAMIGAVLLSMGTVFLALSVAYVGYGVWTDSKIQELNYSLERPSNSYLQVARDQTKPSSYNQSGSSSPVGEAPEDFASIRVELIIEQDDLEQDGLSSDVDDLDDKEVADRYNIQQITTVQDSSSESNPTVTTMSNSSDFIDSQREEAHVATQDVDTSLGRHSSSKDIDEESFAVTSNEDDILKAEELHQESSNGVSAESEGAIQSPALNQVDSEGQSGNTNLGSSLNSRTGYSADPGSLDVSVSMADIVDLQLESSKFSGVSDGIQPARRLLIPTIGVDSGVRDLELVSGGDELVWENPTHIVGHIPTTAYPGARGQGWYFGHLESPVLGGGNVFHRLPEIPSLLQNGETIQVVIEAANLRYVYQVYETKWVTAEDLFITDSGLRDITLVTCWPRFHYDKRLLVTAALVDVVQI